MLKIRLKRVGKKNSPSFRIVLVDSRRSSKSGAIKEVVGFYNPKEKKMEAEKEKIKNAIKNGAQLTDTVNNLLIKLKIIEGKKKNVLKNNKTKNKDGQDKKPENSLASINNN